MKKILQLDWIFLSLCAKFQLQIIFFEGFRGGGQLGPSSVSPCQSFNDTYCSLGGCPLPGLGWGQAAWCPWACRGCWGAVHRCLIGEKSGGSRWPDIYPVSKTRFPAGSGPDFRPAKTRLRPPSPGRRQSCRACRGTWPDVLPLSRTRFPAGVGPDFRPARDPSPATVPGTPAKLPGVLGHVARCVPVIDDPFSGQGRPVCGRQRPVSSHRPRGDRQAAGRAGAASPRRGQGIHLPSSC